MVVVYILLLPNSAVVLTGTSPLSVATHSGSEAVSLASCPYERHHWPQFVESCWSKHGCSTVPTQACASYATAAMVCIRQECANMRRPRVTRWQPPRS